MKEVLIRYISQNLLSDRGHVNISENDDLLGSGLIDSVGIMSLILFIEEDLQIKVPPEDVVIEHFLSVNTIDAYLRERQEA